MALICSKCGTRNLEDNENCRRCHSELELPSSTRTELLLDEEASILDGRWMIDQPLDSPNLFSGTDLESGNLVLIRRLDRIAARDRTLRSQFVKEAKMIAGIDSSHVVRILAIIDDTETPSLVMAAPVGISLNAFLSKNGKLAISISMVLFKQLVLAIQDLHASGITHRNLNPDNIYIGAHPETGLSHLTITDFALANSMNELAPDTDTGTLIGMKITTSVGIRATPYLPPELLIDKHDFRSDIYAAGAILFRMLTNKVPIARGEKDENRIAELVRTETPTPARVLRPEIDLDLEQLLESLLSKNPNARPIDCETVVRRISMLNVDCLKAVPQGSFYRGCVDKACRKEEKPGGAIDLSGFYMDCLPVTVSQYRKFLDSTGGIASEIWDRFNPPEKDEHPVVFVNHYDAKAYAKWAGKRLPTEAEWEKAARGDSRQIYPWGDEPPSIAHAHFNREPGTCVVGQHYLGKSPYGVEDLAGNVFEWVEDWYGKSFYESGITTNPTGPLTGTKRVLKGGSFVHDAKALRISSRGRYKPEERKANHGFRCAWSID